MNTLTETPTVTQNVKPQKTVTATVATVFGFLVLLLLLVGYGIAAFYKPVENTTLTGSAAGIEEIRVYSEGGTLEIEYANVEDVTLEIAKSSKGWKLEQLDDTLFVKQKNFIGVCFNECPVEEARLILPETLKTGDGLTLDITSYDGSINISGDFKHLEILASNSNLVVAGTTETIDSSLHNKTQLDTENLTVRQNL